MAKVELTSTPKPPKPAKPAAPEQPATPPPPPTAEELAERQENMRRTMFAEPLPLETPKTDPEPPAPASEPETEPPKPPAAEKPAAAPGKPESTPSPAPATATKDDVEAAARRAAQLVADQRPPAPAPAAPAPAAQPASPTLEMSPEDKKDYEVVAFLERTEPAKYRGRTEKFMAYTRAYYAYQDEWGAKPENEGKEFDPDDQEHTAWFKNHDPGTTEDEIEAGKEKVIEDRIYQNKIKPELDKINREKVVKEARAVIHQNVGLQSLRMVEAVNPELGKLFKDDKGNTHYSKEAEAAMEAADPIANKHIQKHLEEELGPMLIALEYSLLTNEKGESYYPLNPANNKHHARIANTVWEAEQERLKAAPETRIVDGKEFTTMAKFNLMSPEEQAKHYVLTADDIEAKLVESVANDARKSIEEADNLAKRKYKPAAGNGAGATEHQPPTPTPTPSPRGGKPNPPSTPSGGDTARTHDQPPASAKKFGETMVSVMYK